MDQLCTGALSFHGTTYKPDYGVSVHGADTTPVDQPGKPEPGLRKTTARAASNGQAHMNNDKPRRGPLTLLDLPMDILKEIVKEVTHTNDLTALALTHSALHNIAIPHIYSRFDIVWPDASSTSETRTGVDAMTYGLATLVMDQDVFLPEPEAVQRWGMELLKSDIDPNTLSIWKRRIGNNYAQYTRKFSLGNGPHDWVQDYLITKESGKMLGTLVALAIAKMVSLETFVWDMPTGIVGDVWLALSSLQRKNPMGECKLERIHVRWHDNSGDSDDETHDATVLSDAPQNDRITNIGIELLESDVRHPNHPQHSTLLKADNERNPVVRPTFSILPPMKSISVLDIDEVSYLDELSILVERSKNNLDELRIGISQKAFAKPFVMPWDGAGLQQVDFSGDLYKAPSTISERRLGGVLGIVVGRIFDIRKTGRLVLRTGATESFMSPHLFASGESSSTPSSIQSSDETGYEAVAGSHQLLSDHQHAQTRSPERSGSTISTKTSVAEARISSGRPSASDPNVKAKARSSRHVHGKLKLKVLELERVPLSIYVMTKAFDWTVLTSLTILDCAYHESLWRTLRRHFQPTTTQPHNSSQSQTEYQLSLRSIHTDITTPSLISFLKETLAPNSLEVLFLQDRRKLTDSSVSIDQIFKGPLRRHRKSLKKLLLDSSDKMPTRPGSTNDGSRWRTWMLTHEIVSYITSGQMTSLRELSVSMRYKDWHYFLRRLPHLSTLRSLNIPYIGDHAMPVFDPRELAMQIVDVIYLRPEIELCYVGISNKCFEILEHRASSPDIHESQQSDTPTAATLSGDEDADEEDSDSDLDDDDDEDEDDMDEPSSEDENVEEEHIIATETLEAEGHDFGHSDESDHFDGETDDGSEMDSNRLSWTLREILFYDDKISIFKARHMRL